jgi:hypothetical protein
MIVYRPHRGSLEDAMKEAKTFLNEWQMKRYVANNWNLAIGRKVLDPEDIIIDSESTDDDRVGWKNVHMVCAARIGNEDYIKKYCNPQCIGYCAYDVSSVKEYLTPKEIGGENFYWVKIQYDDYEKCRHFQAPFVLFASNKEEAKEKIEREVPGKFSIVGIVELDKSLVFHPQDLFDIKAKSVLWE